MITVGNQPDDQRDGAPTIKVTFLGKLKAPWQARRVVAVIYVHVISAP